MGVLLALVIQTPREKGAPWAAQTSVYPSPSTFYSIWSRMALLAALLPGRGTHRHPHYTRNSTSMGSWPPLPHCVLTTYSNPQLVRAGTQ